MSDLEAIEPESCRRIKCGRCRRADSQPVLRVRQQLRLQCEHDAGRAEYQRTVNESAKFGRLPESEQDRDGMVENEKRDQKWFCATKKLGLVVLPAPDGSNTEGKQEADNVEPSPGLIPGNAENGAIEDKVIPEQENVISDTRRNQKRRKKTTDSS